MWIDNNNFVHIMIFENIFLFFNPSIITIFDLYNTIHKYTLNCLETFTKSLKINLINSIDLTSN